VLAVLLRSRLAVRIDTHVFLLRDKVSARGISFSRRSLCVRWKRRHPVVIFIGVVIAEVVFEIQLSYFARLLFFRVQLASFIWLRSGVATGGRVYDFDFREDFGATFDGAFAAATPLAVTAYAALAATIANATTAANRDQ